jgi:hypothetical protein
MRITFIEAMKKAGTEKAKNHVRRAAATLVKTQIFTKASVKDTASSDVPAAMSFTSRQMRNSRSELDPSLISCWAK